MRRRVGATWANLGRAANPTKGWLQINPVLAEFREARDAYQRLDDALHAFCGAKYAAWCAQLTAEFGNADGAEARLEKKILARYSAKDAQDKKGEDGGAKGASGASSGGGGGNGEEDWATPKDGELLCNFDAEALAVFTEVAYWEKFYGRFSTPGIVMTLRVQASKLEHLRGKVTDVVSVCLHEAAVTVC